MTFYSYPKPSSLLLVVLLLAPPALHPVDAIITKEDPSDAVVEDLSSSARFFVSLFDKGDCAGTIVAENYVVTAAHCVCGADDDGIAAIDYKDETHRAVRAYQNPERRFDCDEDGPNRNDVALLEFAPGTFGDHDPRPVYGGENEVGQTIWILGRGIMGQPDDYPTPRSCRNGDTDGKLREGFNIVDSNDDGVLLYDMSPADSETQLEREAIAQDGDSGGPALLLQDGEWMVAGANSGTNEDNSCDWGSVDIYCRLSVHAFWIYSAMDDELDDSVRGLWFLFDDEDGATEIDSGASAVGVGVVLVSAMALLSSLVAGM